MNEKQMNELAEHRSKLLGALIAEFMVSGFDMVLHFTANEECGNCRIQYIARGMIRPASEMPPRPRFLAEDAE